MLQKKREYRLKLVRQKYKTLTQNKHFFHSNASPNVALIYLVRPPFCCMTSSNRFRIVCRLQICVIVCLTQNKKKKNLYRGLRVSKFSR